MYMYLNYCLISHQPQVSPQVAKGWHFNIFMFASLTRCTALSPIRIGPFTPSPCRLPGCPCPSA